MLTRALPASIVIAVGACSPAPRADIAPAQSTAPAASERSEMERSAPTGRSEPAPGGEPGETPMVEVCGELVSSTGLAECDGWARSHSVCAPLVMSKADFEQSCREMIGSMDTCRTMAADASKRDAMAATCEEARDRLDANCLTTPPPR